MELYALALANLPLGAADFFSWVNSTSAKADLAIRTAASVAIIGFVCYKIFKNGFTIPKAFGAGAVAAVTIWLIMLGGINTMAGWVDTFTKGGGV